jgi:hypothetical protein
MWLAVLAGGDGGNGAGDRSKSNDVAKAVLYMLKNFYVNSGDARYIHSFNRDPHLAACAPGWGRR